MTRARWALLLFLLWGLSGVFVINANERGVVRRFGKIRGTVGSGLHIDLPWPCTRLDRINVNEVRTLSIGLSARDEFEGNEFLQAAAGARQGEFLTGDKNVLHLQASVQYRIEDPAQWLIASESPERHLAWLAERTVTDLVGRSGVDYVHPLGLTELRHALAEALRRQAAAQQLGLVIEDVALDDVRPPVQVKRAFLDVSNARAEQDRLIHEARAEADRLRSAAQAEARRLEDEAETARHDAVSAARGAAARFTALVEQCERESKSSGLPYGQVRAAALERRYLQTLALLIPKLARHVFVEDDQPVDVTFPRAARD